MKKLIILLAGTIYLTSCLPVRNQYQGDLILNATVLNPRDTINLGDTVTIYFEVPDSADVFNNGNKIKIFSTHNDGGNIYNSVNKVDSFQTAGGFDGYTQDCKQVATAPGSISSSNGLYVGCANNKSYTYYSIIPLQRGVYFFWDKEPGHFDVNNGQYHLNSTFSFGNIDRHFNLLIDNTPPVDSMNLFLSDKGQNGHELYAFYVK
jgi:hypothetical protein